MISANGVEAEEEITAFKVKYPFAFQAEAEEGEQASVTEASAEHVEYGDAGEESDPSSGSSPSEGDEPVRRQSTTPAIADLEPDLEVPQEVLEFFVPEVEEHLQVVTECLLSL